MFVLEIVFTEKGTQKSREKKFDKKAAVVDYNEDIKPVIKKMKDVSALANTRYRIGCAAVPKIRHYGR